MVDAELFNTDVNSQDVGYNANDPAANNPVGNSAVVNPADSEALKLLTTYLSQSNVPQASTTLPPQYYYPGQQNVAIGQMSGPMGSLTTYSPGIPLFPMSVLDAAERENRAMKQKIIDEAFKPFDEKYYTLKNPNWNNEFSAYQMERYGEVEDEYLKKAGGDPILQRKLMKRDGVLEKTAYELSWIKDGHDATYTACLAIQDAYKDKTKYVDPYSLELSNRYLELMAAPGDFKDKYDEMLNIKDELKMGIDMNTAGEVTRNAVNAEVMESDAWEMAQQLRDGKSVEDVKNAFTKVLQKRKLTGYSIYEDNPEKMKQLRERFAYDWEQRYGSDDKMRERVIDGKPFKEYFIDDQIAKLTKGLAYDEMQLRDDALAMAYQYNLDAMTVTPTTRTETGIPGLNGTVQDPTEVRTIGLSPDLKLNNVNGLTVRVFDKVSGTWTDPQSITNATITGVHEYTKNGQVFRWYTITQAVPGFNGSVSYLNHEVNSTELDTRYQQIKQANKMFINTNATGHVTGTDESGNVFSTSKSNYLGTKPNPSKPVAYNR